MASFNKATLLGYVGNHPEIRYMTNGDAVCKLSLATTERWKDRTSGEIRETTEWHRIVCYRKLAEIVGQYVNKGTSIFLEGRIRTRKWTDKEGLDRYTTEIEMTEMQMLSSTKQERSDNSSSKRSASQPQAQTERTNDRSSRKARSVPENTTAYAGVEEDIPF